MVTPKGANEGCGGATPSNNFKIRSNLAPLILNLCSSHAKPVAFLMALLFSSKTYSVSSIAQEGIVME